MSKTLDEFGELEIEEKYNWLRSNAPHLLNLLTQNLEDLRSKQLDDLYEFSFFEEQASTLTTTLLDNLEGIQTSISSIIDKDIKELKLSREESEYVDDIYKKTLLFGVKKASEYITQSLNSKDGFLYSIALTESTVSILDGILAFKKTIDAKYPTLSDTILSLAAPAIVAAVAIIYPPAGLALKATGIVSRVAEFLQTKNLENTIAKMKGDLGEIDKDKKLFEMKELAGKVSELAKEFELSPVGLSKLGFSIDDIAEVSRKVSQNKDSKKLLKEVCRYARRYIPASETEINTKLISIKNKTLKELQKSGATALLIDEVEEIMDKSIIQAKRELQQTLDPDVKALEKIQSLYQASLIMKKAEATISVSLSKKYPGNEIALLKVSKVLKKEVDDNIHGSTKHIKKRINKGRTAKEFAKKILVSKKPRESYASTVRKGDGGGRSR